MALNPLSTYIPQMLQSWPSHHPTEEEGREGGGGEKTFLIRVQYTYRKAKYQTN